MARLLIFFLLLQAQLTFAQNVKTISIDAADARVVNLSEIAEKVTPIALEKSPYGRQNIFLANEYLFVAALRTVEQYNLTGKHIRTIDCGGYVANNITGDTIKKELYVPVGKKIKCYDYSGKLKKEYVLETTILYCLWHKGALWVQSYSFQPDRSAVYTVNKINPATGEISTLPFEWKEKSYQSPNGDVVGTSAASYLTLYNGEIVAALGFDDAVYKIQQNKAIPFVRWNIAPASEHDLDRIPLYSNGFVGEYLFVNFRRDKQFYFYLENMKTGEKYNAAKIVDDIYQTKENCTLMPVNQKDYFYFIKGKSDIKGEKIGEIPLKNGPVVFIVKPK